MGGYGSGRRQTKKDTVEDCRCLDINRLMRKGVICEGVRNVGCWQWIDRETREITSSIGYEVFTVNMAHPFIRLSYTCGGMDEDEDEGEGEA